MLRGEGDLVFYPEGREEPQKVPSRKSDTVRCASGDGPTEADGLGRGRVEAGRWRGPRQRTWSVLCCVFLGPPSPCWETWGPGKDLLLGGLSPIARFPSEMCTLVRLAVWPAFDEPYEMALGFFCGQKWSHMDDFIRFTLIVTT